MSAKLLQSCPTLAALWAVARQAPLSRQEYWSGLPCLSRTVGRTILGLGLGSALREALVTQCSHFHPSQSQTEWKKRNFLFS